MTGIVGDFRHTAGKIPAGNSNPPGGNLPNAVASSVFVKNIYVVQCSTNHVYNAKLYQNCFLSLNMFSIRASNPPPLQIPQQRFPTISSPRRSGTGGWNSTWCMS